MEERRKTQMKWLGAGVLIILIIAGSGIIFTQNKNSAGRSLNPSIESQVRIQEWIDAMNARDYPRLYALAPDFIRTGIDESGFVRAQAGNPLFAEGSRITGFQVLNQTVTGTNATIATMIILNSTGGGSGNVSQSIPIYIKFIEIYEHGAWKIWAT